MNTVMNSLNISVTILDYQDGFCSMLGGSLVNMAWYILRSHMEKKASRYGGYL